MVGWRSIASIRATRVRAGGCDMASRSRQLAAPTFAPDGLYFLGPRYDADLNLPTHTPAMDWLP